MNQDLLQHILDVSRRMAETRDLDLLLNEVMGEAIHLAGAERGHVVLLDGDGGLDFRVQRDQNGQTLEDAEDQVSRSILRQVVETGEPLVLRDALQDPRFSEAESVVILELRSIMCVPLISRGHVIGAIYVENRSIRGRFRQEDAFPLVLLANQTAVVIENAHLLQTLQQAHDEMEGRVEERTLELSETNVLLKHEIAERKQMEDLLRAQRDLGLVLNTTRGFEETLRLCLETAIRVSGMDCGGIYLVDEATGDMDLAFHQGLPPHFVESTSHYDADTANARVVMAGEPIYTHHQELDVPLDELGHREGLRAIAIIPVPYKGRGIAYLNVASHTLDEVPAFAHTALETTATQIGTAIARSKAEAALQQSQANLQMLFDSLEDFLFVLDMAGRIQGVNPIVIERLGYSEAELLGETVLKVHPPDRHEEARATIADVVAGRIDACPIPVMTKDGTLIPVETKVTQGHWDGQEALFGISRDVTARQEAVKALQENEQFLQDIFDAIQDGISILDRDLTVIRVNQWIEQTYASRQPLVGRKCFQGYQQRSTPCPWCPALRTLETGEVCTEVVPYTVGEEVIGSIELSTFPLKDADGNTTGVIEYVKDISERVRAEEALRASEEKFSKVFSSSPIAVTLTSIPAGRYVEVNDSFLAMTGYSREETLGRTARELDLWVNLEDRERLMRELREQGVVRDLEFRMRGKTGNIGVILMSAEVIELDGEKYLLSASRNITERKRMEEAIRQRNRELAELNDIIATLASTLTLEEVLQRIVIAVPQFFSQTSDATIQLLDETGTLVSWVAPDRVGAGSGEITFHPGEGIAGWALQDRRPINVPDVTVEPRFLYGPDPLLYRSLLVVPLTFQNKPLGTLSVTSPQVGAFSEEDEQLLLGLGRYAAIAVQNAHLYEQTRRDAETKTTLLREVNHRVKNNLTSIIGLIDTERRYARAESRTIVQEVTERLIQRINGLALVHEMLSYTEWAPLPLSDLAAQLIPSITNALPPDRQVVVNISPSPAKVSPRQAGNLALIINELVTNTVKHAVPEHETTHIDVRISLDEDGTIVLEYRDDGPGYGEEVIDQERGGLGIYLIRTLVSHALRGSLLFAHDDGPVTTIRFEAE